MSKAILVAGITSNLHDTVIANLVEKGEYRLVTTTTDMELPASNIKDTAKPYYIPWTAHSPLSARAALLKVENNFENLDEAIVTIYTEAFSKPFHETTWASMDQLIDMAVKSTLFILKEVITFFHRRGDGMLTIAWQIPETASVTPFGKILFQTIRSIVDTLLEIYETYPIVIKAFYTYREETADFAKHVTDNLAARKDKLQRKWIRYSGDRSPLSIFK